MYRAERAIERRNEYDKKLALALEKATNSMAKMVKNY